MSLLESLFGTRARKASAAGALLSVNGVGQPRWTPRRYDRLADEGYVKNVVAYRAITEIAQGAAGVPWLLYQHRGGRRVELETHPLLALLDRPNPAQGGAALRESLAAYLLIAGNAYLEAVGEEGGPPRELHVLRPDRMAVVPGPYGLPSGWAYTVGGQTRRWSADPLTGGGPILHLKRFHPLDDWYGMSPIEAAAFSIDQHNAAGAHNQALLQNGARPTGALVFKPGEHGVPLSDEQRRMIRDQIAETHTGPRGAGRTLVLEGDFEWREMALSPRDMDFVNARNTSARDVALAFGFPPFLLGIPGDNTYANQREARLALWEQTILPLLNQLRDALNGWLGPRFGDGLTLDYDVDAISALALRRERVWDRVRRADFLTVNEKRAAVGYAPLPGGDDLAGVRRRGAEA